MKSKASALAGIVVPFLAAFADPVPPGGCGLYSVRSGDTLSAIAARNGTTVAELVRENGIADANRIRVGQTLRLPAPEPVFAPEPVSAAPDPVPVAPTPVFTVPEDPAAFPRQPFAETVPSDFREETPPSGPVLDEPSFFDTWIRGRLAVGLSVSRWRLTDPNRPEDEKRQKTFLGYLNHLSEENPTSFSPEVSWLACDFVRIGLTYQTFEARTRNFKEDPVYGRLSDGNVRSSGPMLLVEGVYPLQGGIWRPHAGVGVGWFAGHFSEDTWWRLGYSIPAQWKDAGRPAADSAPVSGRYRSIEVDDAIGTAFVAGIAWLPIERLSVDLSVRRTFLEPDATFGYDYPDGSGIVKQKGEFTLDSVAVALTASYVF